MMGSPQAPHGISKSSTGPRKGAIPTLTGIAGAQARLSRRWLYSRDGKQNLIPRVPLQPVYQRSRHAALLLCLQPTLLIGRRNLTGLGRMVWWSE